ncbi:alpha-L-rhamnosidase [Streptomyces pilosus]|uniref:alpha-L-rhamnosidase n=1 Tax=Streptomyces pilosus TaxID=28893 RepID=UPI001676C265|nr:alpha-L-rhamnosidase [Streptomyces pilosus]GGV46001.1 alpha-L-rhamnosidase [Streptomyces pilosus]
MPGTLRPYALTCEHRVTPLGLDEPRPRLSWKLADARRGQRQSAYRLQVAVEEGTNVFDSGVVASSDTLDVVPVGVTLAAATRYFWTVTVWDADGEEGETASSWFETGLMRPEGWGDAVWIEHDPETAPQAAPPAADPLPLPERLASSSPARLMRKVVTLRATPAKARLYVTARGLYRMSINGNRVGADELTPGWTDYRHRVLYQTYDVTAALSVGPHVLGALLADGWWSGYLGFDPRRPAEHYGTRPQLIARLVVTYGDGSTETVVTDSSWRETTGHVLHSDLVMGEMHDARREPEGWDRAATFDDAEWSPVRVADHDHHTLLGALDEPVRVTETVEPVGVTRRADDRVILDLGQNLVGRMRLTVRDAAPGTRLTLRHAEVLGDDGELYTANLRSAEATDLYVTAGRPVETFEPVFTVHGFRYAEVTGHADVTAVALVMHSDMPTVGEFECSDPDVNRLWSNIRWGQRGNFVSVPTDCPQRDERLGWLADTQVFAPTACYNADVQSFFSRWLLDVMDGQHERGAFPDVAPVLDRPALDREGAPAWGDAGVLVPWLLYRVYGDRRTLERCFDSMTRWIDWIAEGNPDRVWSNRVGHNYGDWLQVDAQTPRDVLATAYFARSTDVVADAAETLGHADAALTYRKLATDIRDAFRTAFVADDGTVAGDTQTGYLLALSFGLLPDHLVQPAVDKLASAILRTGNRLTTGFVGVALLCPTLSRHGRDDLAHALLRQSEYPSWLYSVRHGATTIWERWDGYTEHAGFQAPTMNSFNHYALGSVGEWLYARVAGIAQADDSTAFTELLVAPAPGDLCSARARYDSVRGPVTTAWSLDGTRFTLDVSVPPGARATVRLPLPVGAVAGDVRESGVPLEQAPGVTVEDTEEPNVIRCRVGSGDYRFTVPVRGSEREG